MKIQDPSEDFERCMNSNMHLHAWHNTRFMSFSVKSSGQKQSELLIREWATTKWVTNQRVGSRNRDIRVTQTTQASRVDTSRVDINTERTKTWVDANTESGKIIWEDQAPKRNHTNSAQQILQQQQKSDRQHTRLHQRKYDLTFLKCLQSGIIRGTRSLHKLAEWSKSHRQCFLWEGVNEKQPFQRIRLKNLIGGIILTELKSSVNSVFIREENDIIHGHPPRGGISRPIYL